MKKLSLFTFFILFGFAAVFAQADTHTNEEAKSLPSVNLATLDGSEINTANLENDGKPIIISFWATWCKPCVLELNTIHDEYPDWVEETGVKLVAVSIDDARNKHKVSPFINGKGWEYDILLDENGDFKRAMGVNNVPHTFLVNGKGEIVWSHTSYSPGDEEELYDHVVELAENAKASSEKH